MDSLEFYTTTHTSVCNGTKHQHFEPTLDRILFRVSACRLYVVEEASRGLRSDWNVREHHKKVKSEHTWRLILLSMLRTSNMKTLGIFPLYGE